MDAEAEFVNMQLDAIGPVGSVWEGKAIPFGAHVPGNKRVEMMNVFPYNIELLQRFETQVARYVDTQEALAKCYEIQAISDRDSSRWKSSARQSMDLSLAKMSMMGTLLDTEDEVIEMVESAIVWHRRAHTWTFLTFTSMFQRPWNQHMLDVLDAISNGASVTVAELPDRIAARKQLYAELIDNMVNFAFWWTHMNEGRARAAEVQALQSKMDELKM